MPAAIKRRKRAAKPGATGVQLGGDVARGRIMFGATRVFAEKGFRNTAVEDLLEAGQVSRRTFYRFFTSKDAVALAMYAMGTTTLVETMRRRLAADPDPLKQLEACVDSHLANVRTVGRLVFVLGGEAQSLESPLHPHRMAVHDQIVQLLRGNEVIRNVDPLVVRTLVIALEQCVRIVLQESDEGRRVTEAQVSRARAAMMRIATGTFAGLLPAEPTPMPRAHH